MQAELRHISLRNRAMIMLHPALMTRHISKLLAAACLLVTALLLVAIQPVFAQADRVPQAQAEISLTFAPLVREAAPAVVNIFTERSVATRATPLEQLLYGVPPTGRRVQNSLGSGVIVSPDGVIVTNNHVIQGAETFRIVLSDRREYPAEVLLADARTDLAVLKIDTGDNRLPVLPFADTRDAQVGDLVLAIGNPFGVGQTVTSGIISATARTDVGVTDYAFFIQTDAAVNPGNSGGALVNVKGELVGVNTAIYSRTGTSAGIGFAIPAEMVRRVVDAAVNDGTFVRPWLGLAGQSVSFEMARSQGLDRPIGVMVTEVYPDGPAARSGVRRGDIVTTVDGREVFDERGLKFLAAIKNPGETVALELIRGGRSQAVQVRVEPPPGARDADIVQIGGSNVFNGARVIELSPRLAEEHGLDPFQRGSGIYVHSVPRGTVARNYFRAGDIIRSVNGNQTRTIRDLEGVLRRNATSWEIELERNGQTVRGTVRI
jgi:Do/DeqQ family serine protease